VGVEVSAQAPGNGAVLTSLAGSLGADVPLVAVTETLAITTAVLAVGTWELDAQVTVDNGNAGAVPGEITVGVGTATATFQGAQSGQSVINAGVGNCSILTVGCTVVVTVAGTIQVLCTIGGAANSAAKAATPQSGFPKATGYTAVRVA
jgi:hypothetical protein